MAKAGFGIEIRLVSPGETNLVASILFESFIEYRPLYTNQGFAATTPSSTEIHERLNEGPIWLAFKDGVAVGTASVVPRGEELYVRGMAVAPGSRGLRLGDLLLQEIERFASANGYRRLVLSTTPFLSRAIKLYERLGFQRAPEGFSHLFGTPLFTMVKELEPPKPCK